MDELSLLWDTIWPLLIAYRSDLVASLAFVVSCIAARIAWRNAKAAETQAAAATVQAEAATVQADAATTQADAALDQAREAQRTSVLAYNANEVQALEAARTRIDQASPQIVVTLNLLSKNPIVTEESPRDIPYPHPTIESTSKQSLDYEQYNNGYMYFVVQGTLYNEGTRTARIWTTDATFYAGTHPITHESVPEPQKSNIEHCYVLHPGQTALFELRPSKSMWDLLNEDSENAESQRLFHQSRFHLSPGSMDDPTSTVTITTKAENPVQQPLGHKQWNAPIVIKGYFDMSIEIARKLEYPKNFDYVHAELKDDKDRLQQMRMYDLIFAAIKEKSND